MAVEQQQGTSRAQASQRQSICAGTAIGDVAAVRVVDLRCAIGNGRALQCAGRGVEPGECRFFLGDDGDRLGRTESVAADARSDDGNRFLAFILRFCVFLIGAGSGIRGRRGLRQRDVGYQKSGARKSGGTE